MISYLIILTILIICELVYFKIAEKYNIIDKPNDRSSHSSIVLRGGGIIFLIGCWVWAISSSLGDRGELSYPWFLFAMTLASGISFVDDIHSLPDSVRLLVQFFAMAMTIFQVVGVGGFVELGWLRGLFVVLAALIVFVGATNIYNFMDGINGITAGYSFAVIVPLLIINTYEGFIDESLLVVTLLAIVVFSFFNFRARGHAKCFAGDVGSVGMAFILLFAIGCLIKKTLDVTWLVLFLVYGVDGCLTICHRILLHENLGVAHRKHAYQLMANELKMSHPLVSCIYMSIQLGISLGFIFLCPKDAIAHWIYLIGAFIVLTVVYILFMKKYYHLHQEYLSSLE